ncbi:MAG: DUF1616 domain-containing protein [Candidatus Hodarchaeales archaeon]|jgi:uncharacterized membrane protein
MVEVIIKTIFGGIYAFFLPGYVWSHVLFKKDEIDIIERVALSFGLSIALVPILVFWGNYFLGVKINLINVSGIILLIILVGLIVIKIKSKFMGKLSTDA